MPSIPSQTSDPQQPLLECRQIGKTFWNSRALGGVDFDLYPGEIHGLVGSNGAGKSTLMKILAGALPDHEGSIRLGGVPVTLHNPAAARRAGIAMVYQELSGIGALSIAENLFLGRQPTRFPGLIDWRGMNVAAREQLRTLGLELDVTSRLDRHPLVIRQMVEIARGLSSGARVLILDEPTSSLSPPETDRLFTLLDELRRRGLAIIFISHFLEDVLEICDQITVLRDGSRVLTAPADSLDKQSLLDAMLGGSHGLADAYQELIQLPPRSTDAVRLSVTGLQSPGHFGPIDLEVHAGECLGIYGFVGAGHQELAHALAGALRAQSGTVRIGPVTLRRGDVSQAVSHGVVLVSGDRSQTIIASSEIYKNSTLAHLRESVGQWLTPSRELQVVDPLLRRVRCQPHNPRLKAGSLSGGNQQKVVLSKWLLGPISVLLLEEPTRGMDVGAKAEVLKLVRELQAGGSAVVLASTEPELILAHSDRVLVMRKGRITAEFVDVPLDKSTLMSHA